MTSPFSDFLSPLSPLFTLVILFLGGQTEQIGQNEVAIPKKKIPFWDIDPGTQRSTAKKFFVVFLIIMILFFLVLKCYEIFLNT